MPHFFIDTDDGSFKNHDEEGFDFPDALTARKAAIDILPDMAKESLLGGDRRSFVATLKNENGQILYVGTLSLVGEWWVTPPAA